MFTIYFDTDEEKINEFEDISEALFKIQHIETKRQKL